MHPILPTTFEAKMGEIKSPPQFTPSCLPHLKPKWGRMKERGGSQTAQKLCSWPALLITNHESLITNYYNPYLSSARPFPEYFSAECAAASLAIGTRNGEQLT